MRIIALILGVSLICFGLIITSGSIINIGLGEYQLPIAGEIALTLLLGVCPFSFGSFLTYKALKKPLR